MNIKEAFAADIRVFGELPQGWKFLEGGQGTAPVGYRWASNSESLFGGMNEHALIEEHDEYSDRGIIQAIMDDCKNNEYKDYYEYYVMTATMLQVHFKNITIELARKMIIKAYEMELPQFKVI